MDDEDLLKMETLQSVLNFVKYCLIAALASDYNPWQTKLGVAFLLAITTLFEGLVLSILNRTLMQINIRLRREEAQ